MIGQIILTFFIVLGIIGIILILIGTFINCFTEYSTNIDTIGGWLFVLGLGALVISIFVGLIILTWR